MLDFKPLTLEQAPLLKAYFSKGSTRICDQTLGGAMMWRNGFSTRYCEDGDCLYFQSEYQPGQFAFTCPVGKRELGLDRIEEYCKETGAELIFCSVSKEDCEAILKRFPHLSATPTRDWFDYLYLAENLRTFRGKKLSGQRNHRNFFLKNQPHWEFVPITEKNCPLAKEFLLLHQSQTEKESSYYLEEQKAVEEVLSNLSVYGFFGGMIVSEGKVVAMSMGEIIGDTLFVHVEKADRTVRGSYQMMVSEFIAAYAKPDTVYVNREEDVGDPGLRYSKESYHPECLLEKYILKGKF